MMNFIQTFGEGMRIFGKGIDLLEVLLKRLDSSERCETFTFEMAMKYFMYERPIDPRIVKGAILMDKNGADQEIYQIFMDKNNAPVFGDGQKSFGRKIRVEQIDAELAEYFDGKNTLIIE